jgi:hypothetical protein
MYGNILIKIHTMIEKSLLISLCQREVLPLFGKEGLWLGANGS